MNPQLSILVTVALTAEPMFWYIEVSALLYSYFSGIIKYATPSTPKDYRLTLNRLILVKTNLGFASTFPSSNGFWGVISGVCFTSTVRKVL